MFSGQKLREVRKSKCITLKKLASMVGKHWILLQAYETGRRKPGADILESIAKALGVSMEEFFEERRQEEDSPTTEQNTVQTERGKL